MTDCISVATISERQSHENESRSANNFNEKLEGREKIIHSGEELFSSISTGLISEGLLQRLGRSVFAYIDLDAIVDNIRILKQRCRNPDVMVMGMMKGNAYGHGAVTLAKHLTKVGAVDRLAVANLPEAIQLRRAGVGGVIHILGNTQPWAMDLCIQYQFVPTVSSEEAVRGMASAMERYIERIPDKQLKLQEDMIEHEDNIELIMATMNKLQENWKDFPTEKDPQSAQNNELINQNIHSQKHKIISDICNMCIAQNNVDADNPQKTCLECLEVNNTLSPDSMHQVSGELLQSYKSQCSTTTVARETVYACAKYDQKQSSDDVQNVNCFGRRVKGDAIRNKQDDVTLRYASGLPVGTVHIKVDTGMSRNGCQPQELDSIIQACRETGVPLEGVFTHLSNSSDSVSSKSQLDKFVECTAQYAGQGLLLHIASSGAVLRDIGTDMNIIRPGKATFGISPDMDVNEFASMGFRPAMTIKGTPDLVKLCRKGTKVGYGGDYTCPRHEWIATFSIGHADVIGLDDNQTKSQYTCIFRDLTGEKCPVVGRVSMDAITVRVPEKPAPGELFTFISADYDWILSMPEMPTTMKPIEQRFVRRIASRVPRIYKHRTLTHTVHNIWPALDLELSSD